MLFLAERQDDFSTKLLVCKFALCIGVLQVQGVCIHHIHFHNPEENHFTNFLTK